MITERKTIKKKNGLQKTSIAIITTSIAYSEGNPKQLTAQNFEHFLIFSFFFLKFQRTHC